VRRGTHRQRLVEVAPQIFADQGYAATSLADLAQAAECSKASLHRYFPTKEALLAATAEPFLDDVDHILETVSLDLGLDADRVEVLQSYMHALAAHRCMAKVVLVDSGTRETDTGARVAEQQRSLVARLTGPRAPLRQQVRARCAVTVSHLLVGDLVNVPVHRLRPVLLEAAIESIVAGRSAPAVTAGAAPA
jgi:AcrR family transcriptional regulator